MVDWVAWDAYAYSQPGYGYSDFAELMNRRSPSAPHWPGFYTWASRAFPGKPFMIAEWGVWRSARNSGHQAAFFGSVARQIGRFPRIKAMVYFATNVAGPTRNRRALVFPVRRSIVQRIRRRFGPPVRTEGPAMPVAGRRPVSSGAGGKTVRRQRVHRTVG